MPLLGFKEQFALLVSSGKKRQTIRAPRKYPIKVNSTLYCYTGLRTADAQKLLEVECKSVQKVTIASRKVVIIDDVVLELEEMQQLAKDDGFANLEEFMNFFQNSKTGFPFKGHLIKW